MLQTTNYGEINFDAMSIFFSTLRQQKEHVHVCQILNHYVQMQFFRKSGSHVGTFLCKNNQETKYIIRFLQLSARTIQIYHL